MEGRGGVRGRGREGEQRKVRLPISIALSTRCHLSTSCATHEFYTLFWWSVWVASSGYIKEACGVISLLFAHQIETTHVGIQGLAWGGGVWVAWCRIWGDGGGGGFQSDARNVLKMTSRHAGVGKTSTWPAEVAGLTGPTAETDWIGKIINLTP